MSYHGTPKRKIPREAPRRRIFSHARSMKDLDYSIKASLIQEGKNPQALLSRRTVKRALQFYYKFTLAHLTSLLVEFIHQQASVGERAEYLTPFKDLLCVANEGNVPKEVLFTLIRKIKHGPLWKKWNMVLLTDLVYDAGRVDILMQRGDDSFGIPTPYFDGRIPIPVSDDSTDPDSIVLKSVLDPNDSPYYHESPVRKLATGYHPLMFYKAVASTPERDINWIIDADWRERMQLPPKEYIPFTTDRSRLDYSHIPHMSRRERKQIRMKYMTPRSLHRERMKDLIKEIHSINMYRPQYYPGRFR